MDATLNCNLIVIVWTQFHQTYQKYVVPRYVFYYKPSTFSFRYVVSEIGTYIMVSH